MSKKVVNLMPADFYDEAISANQSSRSRISSKTYNRKATAIANTNKIKFEEKFDSQLDKEQIIIFSEIKQAYSSGRK